MNSNSCKFISTKKSNSDINIINFVYEQQANFKQSFILTSVFCIGIIVNGSGFLHTSSQKFELNVGDLFFTFPAKPYYIENGENLKYIYINFIGTRAAALTERLKITYSSPVITGFDFLIDHWQNTFDICNDNNTDLFCEGLLLHSLAFICNETIEENTSGDSKNGILTAKQYIDVNFTDNTLNLKTVSERFSYNPKYFSAAFKNMVRVNFSEYLKKRRLSYAVTLIKSGNNNIKEIAEMCGYSDPLYFSKSFKQQYGISPKKYYTTK